MATTITPRIVTVNTTLAVAPEPSSLQGKGAIVSTGGTTQSANTVKFYGNMAAVNLALTVPLPITSLAWASGEVTATVGTMTYAVGQTFITTIAGASPSGYNGTFVATVVSTTTFTYNVVTDPGTETSPGTYLAPGAGFVSQAAASFFAQGTGGVYILELGEVTDVSAGVTALSTYIAGNQTIDRSIYAYLVPPAWDATASSALNTLAGTYASNTACTYFFITSTTTGFSAYTYKSCFVVVASDNGASGEVTAAGAFAQWCGNAPGVAHILAPMQYRQMFGFLEWPSGAGTNRTTILSGFGNYIGSANQGGLTEEILYGGRVMSGTQASMWYGIDWIQLNAAEQLSAAVINGSNTQPPLLYDQTGINTLQAIAQGVADAGVTYGCAQSATVTAVPFATYVAENPDDYGNGVYAGLSATVVAQSGFMSITFNLAATQFPGA